MEVFKNKVIVNAIWITVGQVIELIIAFLFGILITRYLSEGDNGNMNYAITMMNVFLPFATLSTSGVLTQKLVANKEKEGVYMGTLFVFRIVSGLLSSILMLIAIVILNPSNQIALVLGLLQTFSLIGNVFELFSSWYNFKSQASKYVILRIVTCLLVSGYKAVILMQEKNVYWFSFSNTLDSLIISLLCLFFYKKHGGKKFVFSFHEGMDIVKRSSFFIFSSFCAGLLMQVDKLIVKQYHGEVVFSHYYMALYIGLMWGFVLKAMVESARVSIAEAALQSDELFEKRMSQLYSVVIWSGIAVCLGIVLLSPYLLVFLYGENYRPSGIILAIVCWGVIFQYITYARNIWLIEKNKNQYELVFYLIGIIITVCANFAFTPQYGIQATAWIFLFTQFAVAILLPLIFGGTRGSVKMLYQGFVLKHVRDSNRK